MSVNQAQEEPAESAPLTRIDDGANGRTCIDNRIVFFLEKKPGLRLRYFPPSGIEVKASGNRMDLPWRRLSIMRVGDAALATTIPRLVPAVTAVTTRLSVSELFSPDGLTELQRALKPHGINEMREGLHFTATDRRNGGYGEFPETPVKVLKSDKPSGNLEASRYPKLLPPVHDFVEAFVIYQGADKAARAGIRRHSPTFIEIGVETDEEYQKRGYGTAVVAAAANWILSQGAAVYYRVFSTNVPSVRIARRLDFDLTWQQIYA